MQRPSGVQPAIGPGSRSAARKADGTFSVTTMYQLVLLRFGQSVIVGDGPQNVNEMEQ